MTEEQAIKGLKENLCSLCAYGSQNMDSCDISECDNRDYIKALEHQPSEDCVSREQAIKTIGTDIQLNLEGRRGLLKYSDEIKDILKALLDNQEKKLKALPPITPTHGTCKDCHNAVKNYGNGRIYCLLSNCIYDEDFWCKKFEKRGNEE